MFTAYLSNTKSVDEIRVGSGIKSALQSNQIAFERILQGILSPAPFEQYTKSRVDHKDRIKPDQ